MTGVPDPWTAVILVAAAWRTWRLLANDEILDGVRDRIFSVQHDGVTMMTRCRWLDWLECPYCAGFWITVAWWAAWTLTGWTLVAAAPLALHTGMLLVERIVSGE